MEKLQEKQKIILSAMKPSGDLHIGNLIGAGKNWVNMQNEYQCYYSVADLHAITEEIVPATLREKSLDMFSWLIALGIDTTKTVLFIQSHVSAHAELAWVLNCYTQFGEARRMTQFKDKSAKNSENINVGLFSYPVLMAADILLYNADLVPIGKDQQQHMELARTIAERFNNRYSPTFTMPDGYYPKLGAKIYSLADPSKKMGKSENDPNGVVLLKDDPDTVRRKFKRAVTDSETEINYNPTKKLGVSNLLTIYATFKNIDIKKAETYFTGKSYADLKDATAAVVIDALAPVQANFNSIRADKEKLNILMKDGAERATRIARRTLGKVYKKVGFVIN